MIHHPALAVLEADLQTIMEDALGDPTLWVICMTYSLALGLALTAMFLRRMSLFSSWFGSAKPIGLVNSSCFRGFDLVGAGWIVAIYFGLFMAQMVVTATIEDLPEIGTADLWVSIAFQCVMAGLIVLVMSPRIGVVEWLGLRWQGWRSIIFFAPLSVVVMWLVFGGLQAAGYMKWLESLGVEMVQDSVRALQKRDDVGFLVLMRFSAIIVAPICEEVIFRGYLYGVAKRFCGPVAAALCSALIFSAAHGSLVALLPLALFGLLLSWLYERTGSLWAPIVAHACFNALTVVVLMMQ